MITLDRIKENLSSVKIKFTIIAILIALISFGVAAFLSTRWMAEEIQGDYREKAALMGTHIIHDLEASMIRMIHQDVSSTLDIYRTYNEVEEVRIFDKNGKEVFTQEPGPQETRVEEVLRKGAPIQFQKRINERDVATFIIPIKSKSPCHTCHEKGEALRGALLLSLNQEGMKKYIGRERQGFLLLFGLIAAVAVLATVLAVKKFFLNPLRSIQVGAEAVEKGDFKYQIPVKSRDEVGTLAGNFNNMAQTLKRYFEELEDKNRQLVAQFALVSRSQKEWQETFDCITDPIIVIDDGCNIVRANRAFVKTFEEFFASPHAEPINKGKCNELFGDCLMPECPHKIAMREKTPTIKEIHGQKSGKIFEVSIFPYDSPGGDFRGSIGIVKDITKKKENEMQVVMRERLAALGQMASGLAHELNNPLATIGVCTEALLNRIEKEKIGSLLFESHLKIVEEEVNRCKTIITSMLSYVKGKENGRENVNINQVLDRTVEMVTFQGRMKDVVYLRNFAKEIPVISGSEGELRQVFLTMIVNALDAMEDRGTLTIETGTIPPIPPLEKSVRLEAEGGEKGFVFAKISDTGPGIPSKFIDRIFDSFFTTKSEKGGTGLGLSVADNIIKGYNGKIEVTSEEEKGATFKVILPVR
jgi:two-component system, NtrC family, sensor kinase